MIKRLEDLAHDSATVKPHVIPQMKALRNYIAELVNFGITVCHFPKCASRNINNRSLHNKLCRMFVQDVVPADDGAGHRQAGCDIDGGKGHEAWSVALGGYRRRDHASHRGEREAGASHLGAGECAQE